MLSRLIVFLQLVLLSVSCTAQYDSNSDSIGSRINKAYGVTSHITRKGDMWNYETRQKELKMMSDLKNSWCRSNLDAYNVIVSQNGTMSSPLFDEVYRDLEKNGVEILPILSDYYNGKFAWQGDWYEKYVTYLVGKYGKKSIYWEVMNEVDHTNNKKHFVNGCSDYVNVLKKTHDIVKANNSSAQILCAGLCDLTYSFLDSLSVLEAYKYFDIVSVHSYSDPEALTTHIANLKEHMNKYGWSKPIWLTECGMSTVLKAENATNKQFFTDLLPAAIKRLGNSPKNTTVSVLRDSEIGYSAMAEDEVNEWLKPICKDVKYVSFSDISKKTISSCPIVVVSETSEFPMSHFEDVVSYVKRGGTIVLSGGTPLYYDLQYKPDGRVERKQVNDIYYSKLHMSALFWWLDKAKKLKVPKVPTYVKNLYSNYKWSFNDVYSSRFMGKDQLKGKDSLITMIEAGDNQYKGCVAGIYKLNSDLKGNVIFQTREGLTGYFKEDLEQARRLPRIFMISFAGGVDKVFWYNFRSSEKSSTDKECHFGLVHKDLTSKKSYVTYQTIIKMMPDGSSRPKLYVKGDIYAAQWIRPDNKSVWALWKRKGVKTGRVKVDKSTELFDLYGKKLNRSENIKISENVIYLVGQKSIPFSLQ